MAIIQSVLVGKGKGKIGNVVLSGLKGQTVAKQLNSSPSNPRTVAQTANRVKMANAVLAWQFLALFFSEAKALRKPLESNYNAFVRITKEDMSATLETTRVSAAQAAIENQGFVGNWFGISLNKFEANQLSVQLSAPGVVHSDTMRVRGIIASATSGAQQIVERAVTLAEFTSGELILTFEPLADVSFESAYIYDSANPKMTNVAFLG